MRAPKVSLWIKLSIISGISIFVWDLLGLTSVKTSIYVGLAFLILTLVPIHFKKLAIYRRDFGITSGILIMLHGALAFTTLMNASVAKLFHQVIIGGYFAFLILILLLITSNYGVQRKLGNKWRVIHAFIWFSLPFSLLHALMAGRYYTGELPMLGLLILGGLGLFGIGKIALPKKNVKENLRDALLVILGIIIAIGVALLYPVSGESSQNVVPQRTANIAPPSETVQPTMTVENITVASTSAPLQSSREFTMQDLAQHNTPQDCYVAYQGSVYDITSYLPEHPGGIRKAAQMCGENIDTFSDQHSGGSFSSPQAQEVLTPLEVGKLR